MRTRSWRLLLPSAAVLAVLSACSVALTDGSPVAPSSGATLSGSAAPRPPTAFPSSAPDRVSAAGDPAVQTAVDSEIGDPRLLDLCPRSDELGPLTRQILLAQQTNNALAIATPGEPGTGEPAQCRFTVLDRSSYAGQSTQGYLNAVASDAEPDLPSGSRTVRRGGLPVVVSPLTDGACIRFLRLDGVTLDVYVLQGDDPPDRGFACRGADFIVAEVIDQYRAKAFAARPVAPRTIAKIDLCETLNETDAGQLLGARTATEAIARFGAYCHWETARYDLYVTSSFSQDYGKIDGDRTTIGGHPLVSDEDYQDPTGCEYSSPQGKIDALRAEEFLDFELYPRRGTEPTTQLCARAGHAAATILDNAELH